MASINMSIKNKNLGANDRYNESGLDLTSESMIASKQQNGFM